MMQPIDAGPGRARGRRPTQPPARRAALVLAVRSLAVAGAGATAIAMLGGCGNRGDRADADRDGSAAGTAGGSPGASTGGSATPRYGDLRAASLGPGASLEGSVPFPADNPWNRDVSADPVDPRSDALLASIGIDKGLHPDFGAGLWNGAPIGIPYRVVDGSEPGRTIVFTAYGDESDPGPYPIPPDAAVEGERAGEPDGGGDRHVIVVDRDNNRLYELYRAFRRPDGGWNADSGAVFDLASNRVRPGALAGWTSADAAGLPIFPGLARYDEVAAGRIPHALRFTVARSRRAWVPPASHFASNAADPDLPPMGMRVRLKASYAIPADAHPQVRVILAALKVHGMIVADNGSDWFISGAPDARWDNAALNRGLGGVRGGDFEVLRMDGLVAG